MSLCLCVFVFLSGVTHAHPVAQGALQITIFRDRIVVHARIAVEEVVVSSSVRVGDNAQFNSLSEAYAKHGDYFLKHFFVTADERALEGKVVRITEPDGKNGSISPLEVEKEFVVYEMEFPLSEPPRKIQIRQNVLNEVNYTPGNPWEATYVVRIGQHEQAAREGILLGSKTPLSFECNWEAPPPPPSPVQAPVQPAAGTPPAARPDFPEIPDAAHSAIPGGWKGLLVGFVVGIALVAGIWFAAQKLKR